MNDNDDRNDANRSERISRQVDEFLRRNRNAGKMCACGCGERVNKRRFKRRHVPKENPNNTPPLCRCGCGRNTKYNIHTHRWALFVRGHKGDVVADETTISECRCGCGKAVRGRTGYLKGHGPRDRLFVKEDGDFDDVPFKPYVGRPKGGWPKNTGPGRIPRMAFYDGLKEEEMIRRCLEEVARIKANDPREQARKLFAEHYERILASKSQDP